MPHSPSSVRTSTSIRPCAFLRVDDRAGHADLDAATLVELVKAAAVVLDLAAAFDGIVVDRLVAAVEGCADLTA